MDIKIEAYVGHFNLKESFVSASGKLNRKIIIQLVFFQKENPCFIFELPLSPSLGEMPTDVLDELNKFNKSFSVHQVNSKYFEIAWSYFEGLFLNDFLGFDIRKQKEIYFKTLSIGSDKPDKYCNRYTVCKFKSSPSSMEDVVRISKTMNSPWSVDFNRSLSIDNFLYFIGKARLDFCMFIEQPLSLGEMNEEIAKMCYVPIYADEDMAVLNKSSFKESGYEGLVLKPIRHNFYELISWIDFAIDFDIPFLFGNMVSDSVADDLVKFFNQYASLKIIGKTNYFSHNLHRPTYLMSNKRLTVNYNILKSIMKHYEKIGSWRVLDN